MTAVGRLLADLGASVTQVHLPASPSEPAGPIAEGMAEGGVDPDTVSIAINRHGMDTVVVDPSIPRRPTPLGATAWPGPTS